MKPELHPSYQFVVFRDITADFQVLTRSSLDPSQAKDTVEIDGTEYPLINIDISSASHPFYTGQQKLMDTEGRVDRYYRKYGFKAPEEPTQDAADASATAEEANASEAGDQA